MSLNRLLPDQPEPEIASSARLLGNVHIGAGAIISQGTVVRSDHDAVSIGNHSAVLGNGVVIGTREHPVRIGQRTVFGHRAQVIGATVGDLCEIGNGAILMPGSRLGDGSLLGEGTLVPAGAVIPPSTVLVGRPPHAIRSATDADRERLAVLREHQTDLTDHPGHPRTAPLPAGPHMGTLTPHPAGPPPCRTEQPLAPSTPTATRNRSSERARCGSTAPRSPASSWSARTRSSA